jgi:hypothetical protein
LEKLTVEHWVEMKAICSVVWSDYDKVAKKALMKDFAMENLLAAL